ncbi:MAG: ABC transporter substrate-binding protein [Alphaproteobacteria bacterium]|nr:ABC transporter substrate-binding protein [Alphaproteobacteria bacterium]
MSGTKLGTPQRVLLRSAITTAISIAGAGLVFGAVSAQAADVKIGGLWGVTGPVSKFIPPLKDAATLAIKQINDQGGVLKGDKLSLVLGDTKCDGKTSSAAANKLVNINKVVAINGALCSGATIAAANTVGIPGGVVMISPASTSPAITNLKDNDFIYRVTPADDFQGKILARVLKKRGINSVAITYIQNDYGKGLAQALKSSYEALGGKVAGFAAHEGKKASYRSELATLKKGGAKHLVVIAYAADSGPVIMRQSLERGYFRKFVGVDGVNEDSMLAKVGWQNVQGMVITNSGSIPGTAGDKAYSAAMKAAYPNSFGKPFSANTYDATFMIALAIEAAGSTDRTAIRDGLRKISGPGGVVILPGEWAKAKKALAAGQKINYEGAAGPHDFDKAGDVPGVIDVFEVRGKKRVLVEKIAK